MSVAEQAVRDTLSRYCHAIDDRDIEAWLDCFDDEGEFALKRRGMSDWEFTIRGRDALRSWFVEYDRTRSHANHVVLNALVSVSDDRATAASYFLIMRPGAAGVVIQRTGRYADKLVRGSDGVWRLTVRHAFGDLSAEQ